LIEVVGNRNQTGRDLGKAADFCSRRKAIAGKTIKKKLTEGGFRTRPLAPKNESQSTAREKTRLDFRKNTWGTRGYGISRQSKKSNKRRGQ